MCRGAPPGSANADALDLVRGQKWQKAFDYTFSTVEGKFLKGDKILYQGYKT